MATAQPKSGLTEYSISTGTGALALTGPAPGFRGFVSADDGLLYHYAIFQDQIAFEAGVGTYNHSLRQLARTTVLANINGTGTPLNLGAGTKEVSCVLVAERVMMSDCSNQISAEQFHNGSAVNLDADHDSYLQVSTDDVYELYLNGVQVVEGRGGLGQYMITGTDPSATEGPLLLLRRASTSPAVSDALGAVYFQGTISGTQQNAAKIRSTWTSVTAGAFASTLDFSIAAGGALLTVMTMAPNRVTIPSTTALFTGGKAATSLTTAGAEFFTNGVTYIVCVDGSAPLVVARGAGDGTYVNFVSNGATLGDIHNTSGTVSVGAFTGNHYGDFAPGVLPEYELPGTVLAGTGNLLPAATAEPFYELVPATNGDRRVLGVYGGRKRTTIMGGAEQNLIVLWAVGNGRIRASGPIAAGNLLWASATPGVAEKQPNQDQVGPWTVAKATNNSPDDGGERLVSCIYMAG